MPDRHNKAYLLSSACEMIKAKKNQMNNDAQDLYRYVTQQKVDKQPVDSDVS